MKSAATAPRQEKGQICLNCYFFMQTSARNEQTIGYCRANPPIPYYEKNEEGDLSPKIARFPIVLGNMWCGAWDAKEDAA
jgi:hypothetical protein